MMQCEDQILEAQAQVKRPMRNSTAAALAHALRRGKWRFSLRPLTGHANAAAKGS
jgi:hypothetical protein